MLLDLRRFKAGWSLCSIFGVRRIHCEWAKPLLHELAAFAFKPAALSASFSIFANAGPNEGGNDANGE
jgi:hypothetical protein